MENDEMPQVASERRDLVPICTVNMDNCKPNFSDVAISLDSAGAEVVSIKIHVRETELVPLVTSHFVAKFAREEEDNDIVKKKTT